MLLYPQMQQQYQHFNFLSLYYWNRRRISRSHNKSPSNHMQMFPLVFLCRKRLRMKAKQCRWNRIWTPPLLSRIHCVRYRHLLRHEAQAHTKRTTTQQHTTTASPRTAMAKLPPLTHSAAQNAPPKQSPTSLPFASGPRAPTRSGIISTPQTSKIRSYFLFEVVLWTSLCLCVWVWKYWKMVMVNNWEWAEEERDQRGGLQFLFPRVFNLLWA